MMPFCADQSRPGIDGTFTGLEDTKNKMISFRGVRFADPPVGDLRWKAPVMPPSRNLGKVSAKQVLIFFLSTFLNFLPISS